MHNNNYKVINKDCEKGFYNIYTFESYKDKDIVILSNTNNKFTFNDKIDLYTTLLQLNTHAKYIYKELLKLDDNNIDNVKFRKYICNKYNISRLTYMRAIDELIYKGIITKDLNNNLNIRESYKVKEDFDNAKILVIKF